MRALVVGSIALDHVITPVERHEGVLGGSASYAALAASFFAPVDLVGIVGSDFPGEHVELFRSRGIDLAGLEVAEGRTFAWTGEYSWDYNSRTTLSVEPNVFERFRPELPARYCDTPYVLLGNIEPRLQIHVLDQMRTPKFVAADTMDRWIDLARDDLTRLLPRIDLLILNDGEARQLTGQTSLIRAGRLLRELGASHVAIKKGEHGCLLFGDGRFFSCGAYPLEELRDPTGAGDCFAGALVGHLAKTDPPEIGFEHLRRAVAFASVIASFNVEAFSVDRLRTLTHSEIDARYEMFRLMSQIEAADLAP